MWVSLNFGVWITSSLSHHYLTVLRVLFSLTALAKITLTLPKGTSSSELLSPNYPDSFPDDDVMEWYFQVPDKHKTAVQLLKLTQPHCLKKDTAVEYHSRGRGALVLRLTDPQPDQSEGNFSLTLRNCEMDRRRAGSPGLSLSLKVSSSSKSSSGLYVICTWCCRLALKAALFKLFTSAEMVMYLAVCRWHCMLYISIFLMKYSGQIPSQRKVLILGMNWISKNAVLVHISLSLCSKDDVKCQKMYVTKI